MFSGVQVPARGCLFRAPCLLGAGLTLEVALVLNPYQCRGHQSLRRLEETNKMKCRGGVALDSEGRCSPSPGARRPSSACESPVPHPEQ